MLKELLEGLREGKNIILSSIPNQYGNAIEQKVLVFVNGQYEMGSINCYSSRGLGLGNCGCNSHPCMRWEPVPRKVALAQLRLLVAKQLTEEKQAKREIAWLDKAINELS